MGRDREQSDPDRVSTTLGVYTSVDLINEIRSVRDASHRVMGDVILDAIEITYPQLQEAFEPPASGSTGRVHLFDRAPERTRHGSEGTQGNLVFSVRAAHKKVIDDLVEQLGAPNRSALLAKAIELYIASLREGEQS